MTPPPRAIIGMYAPKYDEYLEVMFHLAHTFGIYSTFTINDHWGSYAPNAKQRKTERYPPFTYYPTFEGFFTEQVTNHNFSLIVVETRIISDDAQPLESFVHPAHAAYLFIGRDLSLPAVIAEHATARIKVSDDSLLKPGIAAAILLYDRHYKEITQ